MERLLKSGEGWRLGWNPEATTYQALVGGENWAFELTEAEFNEFCRLIKQLTGTLTQIAGELMEEEKIACEAESDLMWMELEGFPHAYSLHVILHSGRCAEGKWPATVVPHLLRALEILKVF
jgi:hypothetical protein